LSHVVKKLRALLEDAVNGVAYGVPESETAPMIDFQ